MSRTEGRKFGLTVGAAFVVLGAVVRWRGHLTAAAVLWTIGGLLLAGGLLIPGSMGPVYRAWMKLALALSKVTTPIFMGLIYYGLFAPMGFVRRTLGRNALVRPRGDSFWIDRVNPADRRSDLQRQF